MNKKDLQEFKEKREMQKHHVKCERMIKYCKICIYVSIGLILYKIFGEIVFYVFTLVAILAAILAIAFEDKGE